MTPDPGSPQPDPLHDRRAGAPSQARTASTPGATGGSPHASHIPARIGPYIVRRLIASGGMGNVYECLDERLGKLVAVKVAHPDLASRPSVLADIREEARRMASVKDTRYVCRVLSAGDVQIGSVSVPWVAMDYEHDAETLGGPHSNAWPLEKKVEFFVKVCSAVRALHDQHLVHADIKPANILVVGDEPRLIDFGIARVVKKLGGDKVHLLAGTPGYLDPALGSRADARPDQRSDIFALGLTLAEFITGRPPEFGESSPTTSPLAPRSPGAPAPPEGPTPREQELDAILDALGITLDEFSNQPSPNPAEKGTPIWPSRQSPPSRANHAINRELDGILLRAIDSDPDRRFQSVAALERDLKDWLTYRRGLPVRIADRARAASRYGSMLLIRSRFVGLMAIAIVTSVVAFACSWPVFKWEALAGLTQRLIAQGRPPDGLSEVCVIDGSDDPSFFDACARHGVDLPNVSGRRRLAWAALADKLASVGDLRAVGFDLTFKGECADVDATLRKSLRELAKSCKSRSVVVGMDYWNNSPIEALRSESDIKIGWVCVDPADGSDPPFAHLALKRQGQALADGSFSLWLVCACVHPAGEPRITLDKFWDEARVTFQSRTPSGGLAESDKDRVLLPNQSILKGSDRDSPGLTSGDLIAKLPVFSPPQAILDGITKSAANVLDMSRDDLKAWIGNRAVIIGGQEGKMVVGQRSYAPVYVHATVVQALVMHEFMNTPDLTMAFGLTALGSALGALLGWMAWLLTHRRSTAAALAAAVGATASGILIASLGCIWLGLAAWYFVNPIIICLAMTLAVIAVVTLGRGTRALLNTDL